MNHFRPQSSFICKLLRSVLTNPTSFYWKEDKLTHPKKNQICFYSLQNASKDLTLSIWTNKIALGNFHSTKTKQILPLVEKLLPKHFSCVSFISLHVQPKQLLYHTNIDGTGDGGGVKGMTVTWQINSTW